MQKWRHLVVVAGLCAPVLGAQAPQDPWPPPGVLTLQTPGVVPPVALERGAVRYTRDAMLQKIQGLVGLSCVVEVDGSVVHVRVVRSLDPGLDQEAMAAARRWRFKPATRDGIAVRVVIPMSIGFNLKGEPPPSTWPALFPVTTDAPANDADWWVEAKASAAGVAVRVPHPKAWEIAGGNVPGRLIAIRSPRPDGRHFVDISEPRAVPNPLPLPFPVAQLDQVTQSLSKVIGAHDFMPVGGGQARAGDRWWLWQAHEMPTSAASRLPADFRDALSAEFDSLRLWIFVTSVDAKLVTVFCWALVPRGLAPADLDRELRSATAVFDRMIKRMVLQEEPGTKSPARANERQRVSHANKAQLGYALFTGAKLRE
jgi:TonB family protein